MKLNLHTHLNLAKDSIRNAMFLLFVSFVSLCSTVATAQNPLSGANGFMLFTEGDASLSSNESEGPIAIGGNLTVKGFYTTSGNDKGWYKAPGENNTVGLFVKGRVLRTGGQVNVNGGTFVKVGNMTATTCSNPNGANITHIVVNGQNAITVNGSNTQTCNSVSNLGTLNFATAFTSFRTFNVCYSTQAQNIAIGGDFNNPSLNCANKAVNYLTLTPGNLNESRNWNISGLNATHTLVINVNGNGGTINWNGNMGLQNVDARYVLINFYNTPVLNIQNTQSAIGATIFAPNTVVNKTNNQDIKGQIIARSYTQTSGQIHSTQFEGTISCSSSGGKDPGGGGGKPGGSVSGLIINNITPIATPAVASRTTCSGTQTINGCNGLATVSKTLQNTFVPYSRYGTSNPNNGLPYDNVSCFAFVDANCNATAAGWGLCLDYNKSAPTLNGPVTYTESTNYACAGLSTLQVSRVIWIFENAASYGYDVNTAQGRQNLNNAVWSITNPNVTPTYACSNYSICSAATSAVTTPYANLTCKILCPSDPNFQPFFLYQSAFSCYSAPVVNTPFSCPNNLVQNPSFETGNLNGWGEYSGGGISGFANVGDGFQVDGSKNVFVNAGGNLHPGTGQFNHLIQQINNIGGNANYNLSFYGGTHEPQYDHNAVVTYWNSASQYIGASVSVQIDQDVDGLPVGSSLKKYDLSGTTPSGTAFIKIEFRANNDVIKLDAVCFTATACSTVSSGGQYIGPSFWGSCTAPADPPALVTSAATCSDGSAPTYKWQIKVGDFNLPWSDIAGQTGVTYDPPVSQVGSYWLRRLAFCGSCGTDGVPATVSSNGALAFDIHISGASVAISASTTSYCAANIPANITLTANVTGYVPGGLTEVKYLWSNGATTPTITVAAPTSTTTYTVTMTENYNACERVASQTITVGSTVSSGGQYIGASFFGSCTAPANPPALVMSAATCSDGSAPTYKWQIKKDDNNLPWSDIAGETGVTYDPPVSQVGSYWLRRLAFCGSCGTEGTPATVSSNGALAYDVHISGATVAISASTTSYCAANIPANITLTANIIGYVPGGLTETKYLWSNGATTPTITVAAPTATTTYTVTMTENYNACERVASQTITVGETSAPTTSDVTRCGAGTVTLTASGCAGGTIYWYDAAGAVQLGTGSTFVTPSLSNTTTYSAWCKVGDCWSPAAYAKAIIIINVTDSGEIAADTSLTFGCGAYDPKAFVSNRPASGGSGADINYQWQVMPTENSPWQNIAGATSETYDAPFATQTLWYRRLARRGTTCPFLEPGAERDIHVIISPTNPGTIGANQSNCAAYDPAAITELTAPSGGSFDIAIYNTYRRYNWQKSTDNGATWSNIAGADQVTYDPNTISQTTLFRRGIRIIPCLTYLYTAPVTMTVGGSATAPRVTDVTRCGAGTVTLTASGCAGGTVQWFDASGATLLSSGATFTTPTISVTTTYTVRCKDASGCVSALVPVKAIITSGPVSGIASVDVTCANEPINIAANPPVVGATYIWDFGTGAVPATSTAASEFVQWISKGQRTVSLVVSLNGCTSTYVKAVNVTSGVVANAGPDKEICKGETTQIGSDFSVGTQYTWLPNLYLTNNTTSKPLATPPVTTTYSLFVSDPISGCKKVDEVTITVSVALSPNASAGLDKTICANQTALIGGTPTSTSNNVIVYDWKPTTYLDNANVSNPAAKPTAVGTYKYTVTVINNKGCKAEDEVVINVINCNNSSIGDKVFEDKDGNGIQGAGEPGIAGVTVTLVGVSNNGTSINKNAITDANGQYVFTNLEDGNYIVKVSTPAGFEISPKDKGTNDATDSDINANGESANIVLGTNVNNSTIDAGFYKPSSIGDKVFADTDKNGVQGAGEPGIAGVTVTLTGTTGDGTPVTLNTTTDANGNYNFAGLKPGTYTVTFGKPTGFDATSPKDQGGNDATDSDVNPNGATDAIVLTSGTSNTSTDAGFTKPTVLLGSLGNFVFEDKDGNGVQGAGEPGIAGVMVTLTGTTTNGTPVTKATTTDANGQYTFTGLEAGTYVVKFGKPTGFEPTGQDKGGNDATDSDANPTTGQTATITLAAGANNSTIDAGFYKPSSIGDKVFADTDKNGVQGAGEPGIAGVTVTLTGTTGDGTPVTLNTTTDANGNYNFAGLKPGTYTVTFGKPTGFDATSPKDQGGNDATDSDADPSTGLSPTITLLAGTNNTTIDAGFFINKGAIGDFVFLDCNKNGIQDAGEAGLAGVTVTLAGTNAIGAISLTTTTDANGKYSFSDIAVGTYTLTFVPSKAGLAPSPKDQGGNDATDSDINATGKTDAFTLSATNLNNLTFDAGFCDKQAPVFGFAPASITVECGAIPAAPTVTATDNCTPNVVVTLVETTVNNACGRTVTRTWTANDNCGNRTTIAQIVTVKDSTKPTLVGVPANSTVECKQIPSAPNVTATDNCSTATVTVVEKIIAGTCIDSYTITRTWTATDACGNTATATQTISVVDTRKPQLSSVPANITIQCSGVVPAANTLTATDNCDANVDVTFGELLATLSTCSKVITRTWTATDNCGNKTATTQQITLTDSSAPTFTAVPANITVECNNIPQPIVPSVKDNCDDAVSIVLTQVKVNGLCAASYTLNRTWVATDKCGNKATATQIVAVRDTKTPTLTGVPASVTVSCNNIPAVLNNGTIKATDSCDPFPTISFAENIITVTSGFCIVRTWTATDACGNKSSISQKITATDTQKPVFTGAPANVTVECNAVPAPKYPLASDNCDLNISVKFLEIRTNGACANTYFLKRTWKAIDRAGNSISHTQVVTVQDTKAPVIANVPANLTIACGAAVPTKPSLFAADNCSGSIAAICVETSAAGTCNGKSKITRTWTATDACGNKSVATQTITIAGAAATESGLDYAFTGQIDTEASPRIGNDDTTDMTNINVYPNPTSGALSIDFKGTTLQQIDIIDASGRVVYDSKIAVQDATTLDVSNLQNGIYLIRLHSATNLKVQRIVIAK